MFFAVFAKKQMLFVFFEHCAESVFEKNIYGDEKGSEKPYVAFRKDNKKMYRRPLPLVDAIQTVRRFVLL